MTSRRRLGIVFASFIVSVAWGQAVDSGGPTTEFKGKVVIAGSGVQAETAIDIIADGLEKGGVPVKVISGETSRRGENEKLSAMGAVSLLYVNSDIVPHKTPSEPR